MDNQSLLTSLIKSFDKAHPSKKKGVAQKEVHEIWNALRKDHPNDLEAKVNELIQKYDNQALKVKSSLMNYWGNLPKKAVKDTRTELEFSPGSSQFVEEDATSSNQLASSSSKDTSSTQEMTAKNQKLLLKTASEMKSPFKAMKSLV